MIEILFNGCSLLIAGKEDIDPGINVLSDTYLEQVFENLMEDDTMSFEDI